MSFVVTQDAYAQCAHGGTGTPTSGEARVSVGGQVVCLQDLPWVVTGCGLVETGDPPCLTAVWLSASGRLTSDGYPLLLSDGETVCSPSGAPLYVTPVQTRVGTG